MNEWYLGGPGLMYRAPYDAKNSRIPKTFDLSETDVQQQLFTQSVAEKNHSSPLLLLWGDSFMEAL